MRLAFVTTGNHAIGLGHVFRCLTLLRCFAARRPHIRPSFVLDEQSDCLELIRSDNTVRKTGGTVTTKGAATAEWDVVVIDRPETSRHEIEELRPRAKCIVCLDDLADGHAAADIAINSLYAPSRKARVHGVQLTELNYLILDPSFAASCRSRSETVRRMLLVQGGSDTHGAIPRILVALGPWLAQNPGIELNIHLGPAFRHEADLTRAIRDSGAACSIHRAVDDLAALFAGMDLAISAGGLMACELAAAGVPLVLLSDEPKEGETATALAAAGAALNLGRLDAGFPDRLILALDGLRTDAYGRDNLSYNARRVIDGRGADRVVDVILDHLSRSAIAPQALAQ